MGGLRSNAGQAAGWKVLGASSWFAILPTVHSHARRVGLGGRTGARCAVRRRAGRRRRGPDITQGAQAAQLLRADLLRYGVVARELRGARLFLPSFERF